MQSPITTSSTQFEAAFSDETELYATPNDSTSGPNPDGSPGAYDAAQVNTVLPYLPTGQVLNADGTITSAPGLPYAAVLTPDLSTILATVPVAVKPVNYTPVADAWMPGPDQPKSTDGCELTALLDFDLSSLYKSGVLVPGQEYAAYLLVRDTDVSGPLSNHIWWFELQS